MYDMDSLFRRVNTPSRAVLARNERGARCLIMGGPIAIITSPSHYTLFDSIGEILFGRGFAWKDKIVGGQGPLSISLAFSAETSSAKVCRNRLKASLGTRK